jgi:two-component system, OmpR family, response regulator
MAEKLKILIVDDETALADSISSFLKLKGHDVKVISDSEEVISHITERDYENRYDVMLLDVFMPGLEGIELIQMIRRALVYTKIIVMSGHTERNGKKLADLVEEYEVAAVMKKPFKARELLQYLED